MSEGNKIVEIRKRVDDVMTKSEFNGMNVPTGETETYYYVFCAEEDSIRTDMRDRNKEMDFLLGMTRDQSEALQIATDYLEGKANAEPAFDVETRRAREEMEAGNEKSEYPFGEGETA